MRYSLVIPTYNESAVIEDTLRALVTEFSSRFSGEWEIIVSDNASTDDTASRVREFGDDRVRLVTLLEKGKGRALRAAFREARGEYLGFTDSDLSVPPHEIASAFLAIETGDGRVMIGSRRHPRTVMPGREWWRVGSSRIFGLLARGIVGVRASDTQCPLKLMRRETLPVFLATRDESWFFDLEFVALLERLGVAIEEVPVTWDEHRYAKRRSKLSTTKDGVRAVLEMARIKRRLPEQLSLFQRTDPPDRIGSDMRYVVVGLGNPGGGYAKTRHNAGRILAEALAREWGFPAFEYAKTHDALLSTGEVAGAPLLLVLPETFMNESGRSLTKLVRGEEAAERLIVLHDDADLPIGTLRFSYERGAGGQKGVRSIMETLKTRSFVRLRIGIAPHREEGAPREKAGDYVLSKFRPEELETLVSIVPHAKEGIEAFLRDGLELSRSRWKQLN